MGELVVELRRSGMVDWDSGGDTSGLGVVLLPVLFAVNCLVHLVFYRAGWTIDVHAANGGYRKIRYRSKKQATADLENQRELAATIPAPLPRKPSRLPKWLQEPD
jgi:hypothetical protein